MSRLSWMYVHVQTFMDVCACPDFRHIYDRPSRLRTFEVDGAVPLDLGTRRRPNIIRREVVVHSHVVLHVCGEYKYT